MVSDHQIMKTPLGDYFCLFIEYFSFEKLTLRKTSLVLMAIRPCLNNVRMQSFSGPYFPAFGLNSGIYSVNRHIHSEGVKIWTRKTPNTDIFYTVTVERFMFSTFKAIQIIVGNSDS